MSSGVKAGLIGAAVAVVLSLLTLIPCLGCIAAIGTLLLYVAVGILAGYWMDPPREVGKGAGAGAVAGLIAAFAGGTTRVLVNAARFTVGGADVTLRRQFRQLPPGLIDQWRDLGFDPGMLARPGWAIVTSTVCCGLGMLLATVLGAAGGAVLASIRSQR